MTPWERYFLVGRRAGCPQDQMERFQAADVVLQSRQLAASAAARLCDRADGPTAVGYGGARGGGKTPNARQPEGVVSTDFVFSEAQWQGAFQLLQ